MSYQGDIALGSTLDFKFTTRRFSTGAPFTLAGTPVLAAYPDNALTEITAGITLSIDFDARSGLNHMRIVATSGNGYVAGSTYALVITVGTVDGVSVVGEVIGSFSIERTGAALALLQTRLPAALISGRVDAHVGAMAANVVTASALASDAGSEIADAVLDKAIAEPAGIFAWSSATLRTLIAWIGMLSRNEFRQTSTLQSIRNDANTLTLATASVSEDGTTYTRGEWT